MRKPLASRLIAGQRGVFVVEFALIVLAFFAFVFAIMELARALYMVNMLHEVTRRAGDAAAKGDFSNADTMATIRKSAVLDDTSGRLALGQPVTYEHVRIDYLSIARDASGSMTLNPIASGSLPANPTRNRINCTASAHSASCIRLVRVRICDPDYAASCEAVRYQPMFPLISLSFDLPRATTIVPAETLGYVPGAAP